MVIHDSGLCFKAFPLSCLGMERKLVDVSGRSHRPLHRPLFDKVPLVARECSRQFRRDSRGVPRSLSGHANSVKSGVSCPSWNAFPIAERAWPSPSRPSGCTNPLSRTVASCERPQFSIISCRAISPREPHWPADRLLRLCEHVRRDGSFPAVESRGSLTSCPVSGPKSTAATASSLLRPGHTRPEIFRAAKGL